MYCTVQHRATRAQDISATAVMLDSVATTAGSPIYEKKLLQPSDLGDGLVTS